MRTRTESRTRLVSKTVGDKTHHVPSEYKVDVPVVPVDWDAVALSCVRVATTLSVLGAMAWSTVSIGDLLSMVAPSWVAYTVAGVFDLAWIVCMILEWLARNNPQRASLPRKAGWAALGISMALIALHGHVGGFLVIGIGGALVSAIAKSMWSVVMGFTTVELSEESLGWLQAEREEVGTELAMTAERRKLSRTRDVITAERRRLLWEQDTPRLELDRTPPAEETPAGQDSEKTEAVRALARAMDIPVKLFGLPDVPDKDTRTVPDKDTRTVPDKDTRTVPDKDTVTPSTDTRTPPGQDTRTVVHLDRTASVSSYVLSLLSGTPDMDGTAVRAEVRSRFPNASESGIAKAITRAHKSIRNTEKESEENHG